MGIMVYSLLRVMLRIYTFSRLKVYDLTSVLDPEVRHALVAQVLGPRCRRNVRAKIVRIGFWVHYTVIITRNPQNSIGNY